MKTPSQIFASEMIKIDLGLDINPSPLHSGFMWQLMIALKTRQSTKTAYYENESDEGEEDFFYIDFGLKSGIDLYVWDFDFDLIRLKFNDNKPNQTIIDIEYSNFNIENVLNEISKFTKVTFDLDKIKKEIIRQNDLNWD
jgi:hypothetical protein